MAGLHADGVTDLTSYALGRKHETERIIAWLIAHKALRQAMLNAGNENWWVLYTEDGAKDISLNDLKGNQNG
jgi:hypothetical protein